ncbi:MAG: Hsp20/alpha crystallin family protein [Rhodoferax sp.]|nr:Hsp20/alpha crystallin family protein [Rhodoferax sp.]MBP9928920.1 Hsp20/alpha crystallin family protein [Rhodoferax sp.]HQX58615.1 Hsp20/alpha crystallin family protein [Burkholderiaceae bacterium]HQZ06170.1 Hsp20/alpha crystallin family protein [Burkholderiaceae bacterium]HRA61208.1 Hsp20/alpha crystallin family protein [Burkholderiaceae bacterium]
MFYSAANPGFGRRQAFLATGRQFEREPDNTAQRHLRPATAIEQDDKSYTLSFDVPGISREQLSIGIEGNVVRIQSLQDAPRKYKAAYELPLDIEVASSSAKLENGVLTVRLAKQVPASRVTELAIN